MGLQRHQEGEDNNKHAIPSAIIGIIGVTAGVADALAPKDPIEFLPVSIFSELTTGTMILAKIIFSGPAQAKFGAQGSQFARLKAADGRATGAIVNAILVIPALCCTGWHFYELPKKPAGAERWAAIVDEVSALANYVSRVSYAVAVNDEDPDSREVEIGIMTVASLAVAGLQTAVAVID